MARETSLRTTPLLPQVLVGSVVRVTAAVSISTARTPSNPPSKQEEGDKELWIRFFRGRGDMSSLCDSSLFVSVFVFSCRMRRRTSANGTPFFQDQNQ